MTSSEATKRTHRASPVVDEVVVVVLMMMRYDGGYACNENTTYHGWESCDVLHEEEHELVSKQAQEME
jgi:hypothetical protein